MDRFFVFTDGGAFNNPGPAAYGVAVYDNKLNVVAESAGYLGDRTNNFAEYFGFLHGLAWALDATQMLKIEEVVFSLDSKLIVEQINGNWVARSEDLQPLYLAAKNRLAQLELLGVKWSVLHIPREQNVHADSLVNRARSMYLGK